MNSKKKKKVLYNNYKKYKNIDNLHFIPNNILTKILKS